MKLPARFGSLAFRVALAAAVAVLVLAAVGASLWLQLAQGAQPAPSGTLQVAGLERGVEIVRDPFGVPHVRAENLADAFAGLGFVHAQERIWQMDLLRRHARGRLSELFGARTVPSDRLARTLGFGTAAERELEALPRGTRNLLEAYSRGVNAWIAEVRARRAKTPFELRVMGGVVEDWTPVDILAITRFRAWTFSRTLSLSFALERLNKSLGGLPSSDFFPTRPIDPEPRLVGGLIGLGRIAEAWAAGAGLAGPVGSVGFAVGPLRARGRRPLLANDVHLPFQIPAVAFLAHIATPELEIAGSTWPGVPVFWRGANQRVAWGQVALHASTSDIYEETLHPTDPHLYDRTGRWLRAEHREERIEVRGGEPEVIEVITTRHGPLLGSALPENEATQSYALAWTGSHAESGLRAMLRLQRAEGWAEWRGALSRYPAPAATFLYADVDGTIGLQVAGHLPIRLIPSRLLPIAGGRSRHYDWRGVMEFEELPSRHGAEIPWLVASTHPRKLEFPAAVEWLWDGGGASDRLRARLRELESLELDDVIALQRERRSAHGEALIRRWVGSASGGTERGARVRRLLLEWDGRTDVESVGASVYHAFRQRLTEHLLAARLDGHGDLAEALQGVEPVPGVLLANFLERTGAAEGHEWVDRALDETWSWLGVHLSSNPRKWSWGELHRVRLEHPLGRLARGPLRWIGARLGRGPFPAPGDADSVWTMHYGALPSESGVGPVLRYAVDLADVEHAQVGLLGGQSGHPGAPHYDGAIDDWLRGRPHPLWMHRGTIRHFATGIWELHPEPE